MGHRESLRFLSISHNLPFVPARLRKCGAARRLHVITLSRIDAYHYRISRSGHRRLPVAKRKDADSRVAFSLLTSLFGEAKESKSPAAAIERHRDASERQLQLTSKLSGKALRRRSGSGSGRFWGQSPNSPSLRPALRVLRCASQRNCDLTPKTIRSGI